MSVAPLSTPPGSLNAALRALCARPVHDVEELGLHVAATGNAYTFATDVLRLLDEYEGVGDDVAAETTLCTCTRACIPQGMAEGQTCRLREDALPVGYVDRLGYLYCAACHDGDGCTPVLLGQPPHSDELCECCHRPLYGRRAPDADAA